MRMFFAFYKGTLALNICFSIIIAVIGGPAPLGNFGVAFMTGGTVLSILYKEISNRNEYYFYYNRGISKLLLLLSYAAFNLLLGLILCFIQVHV